MQISWCGLCDGKSDRYVTEAVEVLAALAPDLAVVVRAASRKAFVILDGTLLPIDRIASDRPYHSGCQRTAMTPQRRTDKRALARFS